MITGFDPFDTGDSYRFNGGVDSSDHLTNAAGNIALAFDGVTLGSGANQAIVRSAIFPVRWQDFDNNWIENFILRFFDLPLGHINRPDMIITFSYGIHYDTFTTPAYNDHNHNWHLDRFAWKLYILGLNLQLTEPAELPIKYLLNLWHLPIKKRAILNPYFLMKN